MQYRILQNDPMVPGLLCGPTGEGHSEVSGEWALCRVGRISILIHLRPTSGDHSLPDFSVLPGSGSQLCPAHTVTSSASSLRP